MTLSTAGYTIGSNQPLNHARILWQPITGTVTADGTNADLAANDYTSQRWTLAAGENTWSLAGSGEIDTMFISAHSLAGNTIRPQYNTAATVTNLLLWSEQFNNASWNKSGVTVSTNLSTAPDGNLTADSVIESSGASTHQINVGANYEAGKTYTFSVFVKPKGRDYISFNASDSIFGVGSDAKFNLLTGESTGGNSTISVASNGYFRISMTLDCISSGSSSLAIQLNTFYPAGTNESYTGDGVSGVYLWGAQIQTGALATAYVRTTTVAVSSTWLDMIPASPWLYIADNSTIAVMANDVTGAPFDATGARVVVSSAADNTNVGIIRAGAALQMTQPFYAGFAPTRLNRVTEGQQSFSETGQWLGRTQKRRALTGQYDWTHLKGDWYRSTFDPFAQTLPLYPFGIIGNPARMPEDVVWAWAQSDVSPSNMGVRDYMQVGFSVVGFWE